MRTLFLASLVVLLAACDSAPPTVQQDVRDLLQRRTDCNHWAGEEGYDAARRAQINAAYEKLRCAALDADEAELLRRYGNHPSLRKALEAARRQAP